MRGLVVMRMLADVGRQLGVDNPIKRHKPERNSPDHTLLNLMHHRSLSKSRCLYRLLVLNPRDGFIDLLFSHQPAFDIFLHASLLIDEDADG